MRKTFITLCLAVILAGCTEEHQVRQGYVVAMRYVPEHRYSYYNVCLKMTMFRHVPEKYLIWLADSVKVRKIQVPEEVFAKIRTGDCFSIDPKNENP